MNYAIVDSNNLVINIVVWDGLASWAPPEGCTAIPIANSCGIGWSYIDGEFVEPTPPSEPDPAPES